MTAKKKGFVQQPHNSRGFRGCRGGSRTRYSRKDSVRYASRVQDPREMAESKGLEMFVRKSNPPDRSGNISRCAVCDSVMHWVKKLSSQR